MIRWVTTKRGANGDAQLPIEGSKQAMVQKVIVDAHVVHKLGHVNEMPGEHDLCGGVINASIR